MDRLSLASCVLTTLAALAAGCGNVVVESSGVGGSGGTGGGAGGSGGTGGGAGGSTVTTTPSQCAVASTSPGPHPITFHFTNPSKQLYYLRQDCLLGYTVQSCTDGYSASLGLSGACTVDCAQPDGGCIVCGPCPLDGVPVSAGASVDDTWNGQTFTFAETPDGCSCHETHVAPNGKYRVLVPVYTSPDGAINGPPAWVAQADFELPAPGGVVTVELNQSP